MSTAATGRLYRAPLGSDEWTELGTVARDGLLTYNLKFELEREEPCFPLRSYVGRTISFTTPFRSMSAAAFRLMTGRRHPRVSRMHREYRRRTRRRHP